MIWWAFLIALTLDKSTFPLFFIMKVKSPSKVCMETNPKSETPMIAWE